MSMSEKKQNRNDSEKEKFQIVHHEKNAFVVGDKVFMRKSGKNVWRTVASIDYAEGVLYFEDSKSEGVTVHSPNEGQHDLIITTDAWEKAFALLNEVWTLKEARENRKNSVVSCETVDGHPCVIISNSKDINVHTRWYIRRDWWSLLKKENISVQKESVLSLAPGQSVPSTATKSAIEKFGRVKIKPEWCTIVKKGNRTEYAVWDSKYGKEILTACPWLMHCDTWWKVPNLSEPKFVKGRQRKQS